MSEQVVSSILTKLGSPDEAGIDRRVTTVLKFLKGWAGPTYPRRMPRPVRVECRKWPDAPHWEFDGILLGVDAHGTWIGITEGTLLASPVRAFSAAADHVTLVPHHAWWLGTFYGDDPKRPFDTYVDIAMPAVWHGDDLVRAVDLDLDVIRGTTGRVWVDDEDEFAEHRVSLGYPEAVVAQAIASCQELHGAVTTGTAPFDGTHRDWIERLRHR